MAKKSELSVDQLMDELEHPFKTEIQALRDIIKQTDKRIQERVKWNAPSYYFGLDLAAFNLRQSKFVQLILLFPKGLVSDPDKIMLGEWKDRREARFTDLQDVLNKKDALQQIIRDWLITIENN